MMSYNLKTPEDVLRTIKADAIQILELRFTDLAGLWQHFSVPAKAVNLEDFERGFGSDGASIGCSQEIQASSSLVIPDPASAFRDPFADMPTLVLICTLCDPVTGQSYTRDPRYIAQKAEAYLQATQIGDAANFGLELEYFLFNGGRDDQSAKHELETADAHGTAARPAGPAEHNIVRPVGYFPVPPTDKLQHVRTQVVGTLEKLGIKVDPPPHNVQNGPQPRIHLRFTKLTRMADSLMIYKYVVKNVARQHGMIAAFVPKPGGSGMQVHQSIWHKERPLFAGDGYAGSSALMRHYMAGLLEHVGALIAICAPAVNSYRCLMPGFESPIKLGHAHPRSVTSRIPMYSRNPKTRLEFRCTDQSCNPYLAFAAMLMAGIDGFQKRLYSLHPREPIRKIYGLPRQELATISSAPSSLEKPLNALEADHTFLLQGDVFTLDVIDTHLSYNRTRQ
jgi:glutamine synthetase